MELMELLMNKTKKGNNVHLLQMEKTCRGRTKNGSNLGFHFLERERKRERERERESSFSLDLRSFRPSVLDGARSKVDLRVDIDLVEFQQLQEIGIFSYL